MDMDGGGRGRGRGRGGVPVLPEGRGRGRGRGGVPVLPEGMWDALQGNSESKPTVQEATNVVEREEPTPAQYEDSRHVPSMPMGFGRGPGRGGDFGRGGRGGGRGRGPERDAKGKDWECPSCTNVNWSWRSNCNKCNTAKPASALSEAENRDGAGKGFNERQERISASAVEIDEEGFDDFGRRVKKEKEQQASSRRAKEEAALARMNEKYKHLVPIQTVSSPSQEEIRSNGTMAQKDHSSSNNADMRGREDASYVNGATRENARESDRDRDRGGARHNDRERERSSERARSPTGDRDKPRRVDRRDDSPRREVRRDDRREDNRRDDNRRDDRDRGGAGRDEGRKRDRSADRGHPAASRNDSTRDTRDNRGGREDRHDHRSERNNRDSRERDDRRDKYSRR